MVFSRSLSDADDHIDPALPELRDQFLRGRSWIGVIAVNGYVNFSVHLLKHLFNDVSFSTPRSVDDGCAVHLGDRRRVIGRLIVKDEDVGPSQSPSEIRHNLADGLLFIKTGNQNGDVAVAVCITCLTFAAWFTSAHLGELQLA